MAMVAEVRVMSYDVAVPCAYAHRGTPTKEKEKHRTLGTCPDTCCSVTVTKDSWPFDSNVLVSSQTSMD